MWRSVGSPGDGEVAEVAGPHQEVRGAVVDLLGLLVRDAREVHAHAVLRGHVAERADHRREAALHVVGAAPVQAVAVHARLELLRAAGHHVEVPVQHDRRAALGPTVAVKRGRPLC
jgi:hypothetical protein